MRYRNYGKYRTAGTACFFQDTEKYRNCTFWCGIVRYCFYTFLQNIVKLSQNTAGTGDITGITGIETGKD